MAKPKYCLLISILFTIIFNFNAKAQYKVIVTNLNNKKVTELKPNDEFYFGTSNSNEKIKGMLEKITINQLIISGKPYAANEISWIDKKGHTPKKNTSQIARILLYFGGGLFGFSVYEHYEANDTKTAKVSSIIGAGMVLGAICFWTIPRQPQYDFSGKHLLEILPLTQETK
jgi:hypothetical protein